MRSWIHACVAIAGLLVALACGSGEQPDANADAPVAAAGGTGYADRVEAQPDVSDPVRACRSLAEQEDWANALIPCTRAATLLPDDMEIQHALQQAQAAAAAPAGS